MTLLSQTPGGADVMPVHPVLDVQGLRVRSATRTLLHDISFTLYPGDRVGLIGESGSGKSLTSLATIGLLPDNLTADGSIHLAGSPTDLLSLDDRAMRTLRGNDIGMVFQDPMTALNPTMRIGKQVAEVIRTHRRTVSRAEALQKTRRLLTDVRLPDVERALNAYPHELSGGQRQRVVLAIAMANRPSLLLCDEPTTALDVTVQAQVIELISSALDETDAALLFVTHDLAVVASICDRVIVMFGGEILESGDLVDVFERPQHPYTRALIAASDMEAIKESGHLYTIPPSLFDYRDALSGCGYCCATDRPAHENHLLSRWIPSARGGHACFHETRTAVR